MAEVPYSLEKFPRISGEALGQVLQDRGKVLSGEIKEEKVKDAYGISKHNFLVLTDQGLTGKCVFPLEFCGRLEIQTAVSDSGIWGTDENLEIGQRMLEDQNLKWGNPRLTRLFLVTEAMKTIDNPEVLKDIRDKMQGEDDYTRILDHEIELRKEHS